MKKPPAESEFQLKQKIRKIREQTDDVKASIRQEKKEQQVIRDDVTANKPKVLAIQEKIRAMEEKIKQLEPISSPDMTERLDCVVNHVKGGAELKDLADKTKESDKMLETLATRQETANALVNESSSRLSAKRAAPTTDSARFGDKTKVRSLNELKESLAKYQDAKRLFVNTSQAGQLSDRVASQMQRLIQQCDEQNEKEDHLSAELVRLEQATSKAMGLAWQQTAVHKFKLECGVIPPSNGKEATLLEMEEEVGNTMLEQRESSKQRIRARLESERDVFNTLATGHTSRRTLLAASDEREFVDQQERLSNELNLANKRYKGGKKYEREVLHEFEKLKVGYLAGYHKDMTQEEKLQRKVDRRKQLLEDHLENIKQSQDRIVNSVEEDWATLIEREDVRSDALMASKRESRVTTTARLRLDVANQLEESYKPAIIDLMTNIEGLKRSDEDLEQKTSEAEVELRSVMVDQSQVDQELALLQRVMADGPAENPVEIRRCQNKLRTLWRQGAIPMSQVEVFLDKLSDYADPQSEMLMAVYESYAQKMQENVTDEVERLEDERGQDF